MKTLIPLHGTPAAPSHAMYRWLTNLLYAALVLLLAWQLLGCAGQPTYRSASSGSTGPTNAPLPPTACDFDPLLTSAGRDRSIAVDAHRLWLSKHQRPAAAADNTPPWYVMRNDRVQAVALPAPLGSPRIRNIAISRQYNRVSSVNGRVYDNFSNSQYDWSYATSDSAGVSY